MNPNTSRRAIRKTWSGCQFPERVAGDVDGMVALYEPHAVVDSAEGRLIAGKEAIRSFFAGAIATGWKFECGEQPAALVSGDLALTSTRSPNGSVTAEVARRQADGTWRWAIDRFSVK
jgi:ketosteroid isomerase-like protein